MAVVLLFQEVSVEGVASVPVVQGEVPAPTEAPLPQLSVDQELRIRNVLRDILERCERPSDVKRAVIRRLGGKYTFPAPTVICRKSQRLVAIKIGDQEISVEL